MCKKVCNRLSLIFQNGGTCENRFGSYLCICPAGYAGTNCAGRSDGSATATRCGSNPCGLNGVCTDLTATTYRCTCSAGERDLEVRCIATSAWKNIAWQPRSLP